MIIAVTLDDKSEVKIVNVCFPRLGANGQYSVNVNVNVIGDFNFAYALKITVVIAYVSQFLIR
jgi:hypothetical protein